MLTKIKSLLIMLLMVFSTPVFAANSCLQIFENDSVDGIDISDRAQELSHKVSEEVLQEFQRQGFTGPQKRGYAILVGAMIGSSFLSSYIGTRLSPDMPYLSFFIAQVSALGLYALGAPILEPISARFRQMAFGVRRDSSLTVPRQTQLDRTWLRSQENYSLNEQMSRNLISQFIMSVKQNFYEAHRAHQADNKIYAADQIAEAAYRLRLLFRDILPNDPSVAQAVQSAFTRHIEIDAEFVAQVRRQLQKMDADFESPETKLYYQVTIQSWLGRELE